MWQTKLGVVYIIIFIVLFFVFEWKYHIKILKLVISKENFGKLKEMGFDRGKIDKNCWKISF